MANKKQKNISASRKKKKRIVDKDAHRIALIDATLAVIARHGISGATVSRIQEKSKLSRGMINLHFHTKDKLLVDVAKFLRDDYEARWMAAFEEASDDPAAQLRGIIGAEFSKTVMNKKTAAAWVALRAECNTRTDILPYIESRDKKILTALHSCCRDLCQAGQYDTDPKLAALAFSALLEGMYTDFHLHPNGFDRDKAMAICLHAAKGFFPDHF